MATIRLKKPEQIRNELTEKQQKQIRKMYIKAYEEINKQIKIKSDNLDRQYLYMLRRDILNNLHDINKELESGIVNVMETMCREVCTDKKQDLISYGFKVEDVENAFSHIPRQVTENILTGKIYNNNWTFSKSIWGNERGMTNKINTIVSNGLASGKTDYEIAKDLEKFVNPSLSKPSREIKFQKYIKNADGTIMKDKNGKPIIEKGTKKTFYFGDVDYNAQRLARTLTSHAYQQTFEAVNEKDPFVQDYIWLSAGIHGRTCSVCLDRDGQHFKKGELPLDHPNGLCTFVAYIPDSMSKIAERIGKWYEAPTGTYPEIDEYAKMFV